MTQRLTERPEDLVRVYLAENVTPSNLGGYDPTVADRQDVTFIPFTTDWSKRGNTYPFVAIREDDGPTLPDSGDSNYNSLQGDGSGPNSRAIYPITVSVQTMQGGGYLNGVDFDDLAQEIYDEIFQTVQANAGTELDSSGVQLLGMTPPTTTRSNNEDGSTDTQTWFQKAGTINVQFIDTP